MTSPEPWEGEFVWVKFWVLGFDLHFFLRSEHPLSALSHGDVSVVSSFNVAGDAFSDCVIGDSMR